MPWHYLFPTKTNTVQPVGLRCCNKDQKGSMTRTHSPSSAVQTKLGPVTHVARHYSNQFGCTRNQGLVEALTVQSEASGSPQGAQNVYLNTPFFPRNDIPIIIYNY
jgi:hypothetical protein